jgi:hypothetical protein
LVTLVDISDRELKIAHSTAEEAQVKLTAIVKADARDIRSNPVIFREQKYDLDYAKVRSTIFWRKMSARPFCQHVLQF